MYCIGSVLKNRKCIEQTSQDLFREKWSSEPFNRLGWVWQSGPLMEMAHLFELLSPLRVFVTQIQGSATTMGVGVRKFIPCCLPNSGGNRGVAMLYSREG